MPKISIITPVYIDTDEKVNWLDEMIQSVISQSLADWELILIDDKSPLLFDTLKAKYADDNRLRWLDNASNFGPAATRNTAVALAESDCILPLDSDDMLADSEALEYMYDAWIVDKTKTVYGNLQWLMPSENGFKRGKIFELASYTFENATNLQGTIPVTAMHSKDAHYGAGGWKIELNQGREDVEYWIATGKSGYCGQKVNYTTLLYRRHEQSRDYRLKINNQVEAMQQKIKLMHSDIYQGRLPMACCGGKEKTNNQNVSPNIDPVIMSAQNQAITKITELPGYDDKDLEWTSYQGPKKGRFDILARGAVGLPKSYTILGTGHHFQIHKAHHDIFSERQHLHFRINQPDPRQNQEPEPEPMMQPSPQVMAKPELSTLVKLDKIGEQTREIEIVSPFVEEIIIEPNPAQAVSDFIDNPQMPTDHLIKKEARGNLHVGNLDLSPALTAMLDEAGYTVEKLAVALPETLTKLKGIGIKRGQVIIDGAKEFMNKYE